MATVKDVNIEDETPVTQSNDPYARFQGGYAEPEDVIPGYQYPDITFGGGGEWGDFVPMDLAEPQLEWTSPFTLPDLSWYRLAGGYPGRTAGSIFSSMPAPKQGSPTGQPEPPGANLPDWYTRNNESDEPVYRYDLQGNLVEVPGQTLFPGKKEVPLGWNFDLQSQPAQTYSGDLSFGAQGKGKGLDANMEAGALQNALGGSATRFAGLNPAQQAYADMMNAKYGQSVWWTGAVERKDMLDRIKMSMQNNLPNVRTFDPRTLGGHITVGKGPQEPKPGGGSGRYYYGGGGGGRGYSSYSSPASWFNALLSWRI